MTAGLLLLAILSYLPFSVSTVRFDITRQMLAAGIFIYAILLLIPFELFPRYVPGKYVTPLLLALVTWGVVAVGTGVRSSWVGIYRNQEQLLAAIATAVPDPPPGSYVIVHLNTPNQARTLRGLENPWIAFDHALKFMYGDRDIVGTIIPFQDPTPFVFDKNGVTVNTSQARSKGYSAPYSKLIVVDYQADGTTKVLGRDLLQQYANC